MAMMQAPIGQSTAMVQMQMPMGQSMAMAQMQMPMGQTTGTKQMPMGQSMAMVQAPVGHHNRGSFQMGQPISPFVAQNPIPTGPVLSAQAGDTDGLAKQLEKPWNREAPLAALDSKIQTYAMQQGMMLGMPGPRQRTTTTGRAELDILHKVVEDGQQQLQLQEAELAAVKVLKNGTRDFIDYALDEVERVARVDATTGKIVGFDWRAQGKLSLDVPAVRRSIVENGVSSEPPPRGTAEINFGRSEDNGAADDTRFSMV